MKNKLFSVSINGKEMKLYYPSIEECKNSWQDAEIKEIEDFSYMKTVEKIICESSRFNNSECYTKIYNNNEIYFRFMKDEDTILPCVEYIVFDKSKLVIPCLKTLCSVDDFYNKYFYPNIEYIIISKRKWGEPKLNKPKELSRINPFTSVMFEKASCSLFRKDSDLYIKHKDFFSKSWSPPNNDIGKPQNYYLTKYFGNKKTRKERFIYADNWAGIVLRGEGWIKFSNVFYLDNETNYKTLHKILSDLFIKKHKCSYKDFVGNEWNFFLENVSKKCIEEIKSSLCNKT